MDARDPTIGVHQCHGERRGLHVIGTFICFDNLVYCEYRQCRLFIDDQLRVIPMTIPATARELDGRYSFTTNDTSHLKSWAKSLPVRARSSIATNAC